MFSRIQKRKEKFKKRGLKNGFAAPNRLVLFLLIFFVIAQVSVFAQIQIVDPSNTLSNSGLSKVLGNIVGFFTSVYMKAICIIALGGLGIGLLVNRGEPGMIKKFIPWIAGIAILLSLTIIIDLVWTGFAGGSITNSGTSGK